MQYEVELKCLIKDKDVAARLPKMIEQKGYKTELIKEHHQLNDYFIGGSVKKLADNVKNELSAEEYITLTKIASENTTFSVRARQHNNTVLLIVKASTDGGSANHGTQRVEFEGAMPISLDSLKDTIIASGYTVQARWSADRKIYRISNGLTLDSVFSPGYGYQVEFEKVVFSQDEAHLAEAEIREFVHELGLEQVNKDLLERMFAYYNEHWQEYYGTDKVFTLG
ncbi:MAG: hypothetical protein ACMG55_17255 [Microcoleus sp.]